MVDAIRHKEGMGRERQSDMGMGSMATWRNNNWGGNKKKGRGANTHLRV